MSAYDTNGNAIAEMNPTEASADIVSLNTNVKDKLLQALRPKNTPVPGGYLTNTQPVSLLWFSDVHADTTELERIVHLRDKYSGMIDDTVCTGDMVSLRASDGMSFWYDTEGTENILMVIGNHDALAASSGYDWTNLLAEQEQYNRYIAPNVTEWGVQYTSGKTYYYKDYAEKKIRFIALNVMLTGDDKAAQISWLTSALESARTANLSVVVANHAPIEKANKVSCAFHSYDSGGTGTSSDSSIYLSESYLSVIQDFIDAGGEFICHIAGHSHIDRFVKSITYPDQYCVVVDALGRYYCNQYSDTQRTDQTKSQDLANIIVFDTSSKTVKIIRVGANIDHHLRQKNCMTFRYDTGEIISQF